MISNRMANEQSSLVKNNSQASMNTVELLTLSEQCITFEPISGLTHVFFDRDNEQIFCVRSNGVGGKLYFYQNKIKEEKKNKNKKLEKE